MAAPAPTRAMWSGTLSCALFAVPVKVYTATQDNDVHFRQVHRACGDPIHMERHCDCTGEAIPFGEIVKGYEDPATKQVTVLTDSDLAGLPLPSQKQIAVEHFVAPGTVDPMYYTPASYYVAPATEAAVHAWEVFRESMVAARLQAVCKVTLRSRERLALVRATGHTLVLQTLLWPDELRLPPEPFPVAGPRKPVTAAEKEMAGQLMRAMTDDFRPADHADGYAAALQELVERKTAGVAVPAEGEPADQGPQFADLEASLKASLAAERGKRKGQAA